MIIVGAGLSGLIAASMLRTEVDSIFEAKSNLPNNHHALLRFRSSVVGDATGIPFKQVSVMKVSEVWRNPVADAISYSIKCTGHAEIRSVTSANGSIDKRYIAPSDFIKRLSDQSIGKFAYDHTLIKAIQMRKDGMPIISTAPMLALMEALQYKNIPEFNSRTGSTINYTLPNKYNVYATVYIPSPDEIPYRVSITGRELIIENAVNANKSIEVGDCIRCACSALGIDNATEKEIMLRANLFTQKYAKISPIDENIRRDFISWASREHGIYSLGRFACWRPGLLLDDIVNDVRVIQRIIHGDNTTAYEMSKGK